MRPLHVLRAAGVLLAAPAAAQTDLPPVVVEAAAPGAGAATRSLVEPDHAAPPVAPTLADLLGGVPGVLVRSRNNLAQDEQLSLRGFGARSTFGVRGLAIEVDGIPASMPDGQGQLSHMDLAGIGRIEVLRGPWAALHGNASAGVIRLTTAPGAGPGAFGGALDAGQAGAWRARADAGGARGPLDWNLAVAGFRTDGWRRHSAARRTTANGVLRWQPVDGRSLRLVLNLLDSPWAEDPLGLTPDQFRADPRQSVPQGREYDTGKSVRQAQAGATWNEQLGTSQALEAGAWLGHRRVGQFLPIPPAAQANPLHSGGVIDLAGEYGGARLGWRVEAEPAGLPLEFSVRLEYQRLAQHRRGYENFRDGQRGVRGRLRRDEDATVTSLDPVAEARLQPAPGVLLRAGVRRANLRYAVRDHYIGAGNPDDSGQVRYRATLPVAGAEWQPLEGLRLHAAWGRGVEAPTLNELGYRADGGAGLALDLRPARSIQREAGVDWSRDGFDAALTAFNASTRDELAVARSEGGRSTWRNVGGARRDGVELALRWRPAHRWQLGLSATWLDATFTDAFLTCAGPCTTPDHPVPAGTALPGVPRRFGELSLRWGGGDGPFARLAGRGIAAVPVDDLGSARAPGYGLLDAALGWRGAFPAGQLELHARVDNLLDRAHVGSVIVNDGNGRWFEPGSGRLVSVGAHWRWGGPG